MRSTESPLPQDGLAMAQAAAWAERLGGTPTGEDGVEFDAWLEAAPGNRAAYRQAVLLMQEFEVRAGGVLAELDRQARPHALQRPAQRASERRGSGRAVARRGLPLRWIVPATGTALAAGLALAVMPAITSSPTVTAYATGKGQHRHVVLQDGSTIDLDAETKLSVALSGRERRVTLGDGQAIFDVAHDANRPFVVQAGQRFVRDIGTQFDVRQRPDQLTVTVARG
ncbi:MAG TPA: FecR domain-containing protein, partial [Phenylobacterium sp.]